MRVIIYVVIMVCLLAIASGCEYVVGSQADEQEAISAMESAGYNTVRVVERHNIVVWLYGCSDDDATAFEVTALTPAEKPVSAVVCVGWPFKFATIRYR